jgi:hypothetical protein
MGRRLQSLVLVAGLILMAAATSGMAKAGSGAGNYAVGGGFQDFLAGRQHFAFSAHDNGPDSPTGHVVVWQDTATERLFLTGDVTCLRVVGTAASISFLITKSNISFAPVGTFGLTSMTDNGQPVNGQPVDTLTDVFVGYGSDPDCPIFGGALPITSGNILVHDPPLDALSILGCPSVTDGTTFKIDESCDLYLMENGSWSLVQ